MASDHFDDVDHLMKALSLDGVRYRDFSGRAHPPKLKLIGGRREALPAAPAAVPPTSAATVEGTRGPHRAPSMPSQGIPPVAPPTPMTNPLPTVTPAVTSAEPLALPDESLQATFSRLIARAPAPQPRKLKLELQLPPRQPAAPAADGLREQPSLGSLFDRLSGRTGLTAPKKTG